jgi:bifunctional polynucleotide phosphatase/kinase
MTTQIAGFDFDGTLVRPREGRTFPKDRSDWQWKRASVPERIRDLVAGGWRIVIITDQTKGWKEDMIADVVGALGVPVEVLVHRKTKKPDTSQVEARGWVLSFYVGDAAGRPSDWSDCDRIFAERLGVPFHTPEDFFPVDPPRPRAPLAAGAPREVVIMVGYPASGKSTLARELVARGGYHRVDGDTFATPAAMVRDARKHPDEAIVFDSTGGTVARRGAFIEWARAEGRPVRIVWVTTDIDAAMDWKSTRTAAGGAGIPAIAFYTFRKRFEPPTEAEGPIIVVG